MKCRTVVCDNTEMFHIELSQTVKKEHIAKETSFHSVQYSTNSGVRQNFHTLCNTAMHLKEHYYKGLLSN